MRTLATTLLLTVLLLVDLAAQTGLPDGTRPVAGSVVVKIAPTPSDPLESAEALLAPFHDGLGITRVRTWINPGLLSARKGAFVARKGSGIRISGIDALARIVVVDYQADLDPMIVAAKISGMPGVEYAEPLWPRRPQTVPNDPLIPEQWYLERIEAFNGWDQQRGDTSITIGIVDTGIDPDHPDFQGALWHNPGETGTTPEGADRRSNGIDDDRNGLVDDWQGYDFGGADGITPDNDPSPHYYHGTHVAGIVGAAGDNNIGIAGVAWGVRLMSVKVSDEDPEAPVIINGYDGVLYAAMMGCRVINCSWGGRGYSRAEHELLDSVQRMGALVVASGGNGGDGIPIYPAGYQGVLAVAALNSDDSKCDFSSVGGWIGVSAPGRSILSTVPTGNNEPEYRLEKGTSMSAPIVSAVAALVALRNPEFRPDQIAAVIRATAVPIRAANPDLDGLLGSGRVHARAALAGDSLRRWCEMERWSVVNQEGRDIISPGDHAEISFTIHNCFRPLNDCRIVLASPPGSLFGNDDVEVRIGALDRDQRYVVDRSNIRIPLHDSIGLDYLYTLYVTIYDGDLTVGSGRIEFVVNPNYATTGYNRMRVTFTGDGRIGYNDFPGNSQGEGIRFDNSGSLLAEGGLIIGRSADRVADVVRGQNGLWRNRGLRTLLPYRTTSETGESGLSGLGLATDSSRSAAGGVGVDVELRTRQTGEEGADGTTFLQYRLHNTSGERIDGLHAALYLDWDIGPGGTHDHITFDARNRMGVVRTTLGIDRPTIGVMLVNDLPMNFNALDYAAQPLRGGFTTQEKWESISRGVLRTSSNIGDCSMTIGAGPLSLDPGADTTIVFALIGGRSQSELDEGADVARGLHEMRGGTVGKAIILPDRLALGDPYPNPFFESTTIEFAIADEGEARIEIFNPIGERIATVAEGRYPKGEFAARITRDMLGDTPYKGPCFIRIVSNGAVVARKLYRWSDY